MAKRLASFALGQPLFVFLLLALFIAFGVAAFESLPVEAFPDVTDVQVTVISLFPGHAPEEVEKQVTIPLEISLSGIPHAVMMFSHTQFGLSFIALTFDDRVNDYFARQQVLERLQGAEMPAGVQPQLAPLSTPVGELYRYRVAGDGYSPTDLRSIQDWIVSRFLRMAPGVADVVSRGGFIKQYQVAVDPVRLKSYNVTLQQFFGALARSNANAGGSYLEQGEQQYLIRGIGLLRSMRDIGNVVVSEKAGVPLLAGQVSDISVGAVPRQGLVGQDGDDEAVTGIVLMRKGENPSDVLASIKARSNELNHSMLPSGVRIVPYYDRSVLIRTTLKTVFRNLLEGALLVTIVLYIFLGNFRSAAIVAIVIPLSLLSTFIGLKLRGIPANLLSLGSMDFGIIVDGAVIVVENIFRKLSEPRADHSAQTARSIVLEATTQVGRPTLFSMLIIILAHIPIFTLQRHEGRIFAPMAYTVTSALVGSLLFSLTLVPLLAFYLLRRGLSEKENALLRICKRIYRPVLETALRYPGRVLAAAVAALLISLICVPRLGTEFLPELNEGTLWVNITLPPGVSVTETSHLCAQIRSRIRSFPEVVSVVSQAGRPEDGSDPKSINAVEVFVDLKRPESWTRRVTKEQLIEQIEKSLQEIPGVVPSTSQPIRDNVLESISQIKGQVVIKLFGEDGTVLKEKANEVFRSISSVKGVARAFIDRYGEVPQLKIEVDRARAARYGLNVADIEDVVETALGGKMATEIWEGEKKFGVVVRLRAQERESIDAIRKVPVDTPDGSRVTLQQVADITQAAGSINISRESGKRVAAIGVFIRDRDMGSLVNEMQQRVRGYVTLPAGYYLTWGGEFENQRRAMARLAVIVPVSIFLIFILLFNAFQSLRPALVIITNIPFALIGGIIALLITGIHLSVAAAIGFIALFGQAVLNGVVMVTYFVQLRERGLDVRSAVLQGSEIRLRTVLMTTLLAMLGLLPMALSHAIGSEVQRPLAVVIIGGLVSATVLTLLLLPSAYLWVEERALRRKAGRGQ